MKIYLKSFGCKVNTAEDQIILSRLIDKGYQHTDDISNADIILINSCAVTDTATDKVLNFIKAINKNNEAKVIVTGCVASDKNIKLKNFGVDIVIHNSAKSDIVDLIVNGKGSENGFKTKDQQILSGVAESGVYRTRAFFKIQDGCDAACSYCIIPRVRGGSRSVNKEELVDDFKKILNNGSKEIVLVGIHIGMYGKEYGYSFYDLLYQLNKTDGDFRIRISSLEVTEIDDRLISLIADSGGKIAPHLHIPLQSGSDKILKAMNRDYTRKYYIDKLLECRKKIKNLAIGADVMVGFPTESEDDFNKTIETVKEANIDFLHIFSYSDRKGSVASDMNGKVAANIKRTRSHILKEVGDESRRIYEEQNIGKSLRVLAEKGGKGHSENYLLVHLNESVERNRFYNVKIKSIEDGKIYGEII